MVAEVRCHRGNQLKGNLVGKARAAGPGGQGTLGAVQQTNFVHVGMREEGQANNIGIVEQGIGHLAVLEKGVHWS